MNTSPAPSISFEDLYRNEYPRLYRRVLSLVACPQEAEDLTQETFLKAWRAWPPAHATNLYGWLSCIATHTALDALRRHRLVCWLPLDAASALVDGASSDPLTRDEGAAGRLEAALSRLPARQRTLLLLAANSSTLELAQTLGITRRTLSSSLSRLRARAARLSAQEVSA
jgi:RNA polymerase sigma-70 factor (ECF subfamily)